MTDTPSTAAAQTPANLYSRLVRLIEAIADGDAGLALALASDLEREIAAIESERRAA